MQKNSNRHILILNDNSVETDFLRRLCQREGTTHHARNREKAEYLLKKYQFFVHIIDQSYAKYSQLKDQLNEPASIIVTGTSEREIKKVIKTWPAAYHVHSYVLKAKDRDENTFRLMLNQSLKHFLFSYNIFNSDNSMEKRGLKTEEASEEIEDIKNFIDDYVFSEREKRLELDQKYSWFKKEKQKTDEILKRIYLATNITNLLDIVPDIRELVNAEGISLYLLDTNKSPVIQLKPLVWNNDILSHPDMAKHTLQIKAMDFAALTARKGKQINLRDPKNEKGMADRYKKHLDYQLNSILCIPLMHEKEAIGVLEVYNKNTNANSLSTVFTHEDEQMLWRLSEHISIAITKLKLIRFDALTGLLRPEPFFEKCIVKLRSERKREQESDYFALVMGDVDWFKNYNDQNGHEAGNRLLRDLAYLLLSSMREKDLICRYGGEEFLFFLSGIKTYQEAVKFTERVRKKIEEHYFEHQENQPRHNLTMSFGITFFSKNRFKSTGSINKKELIKITNEADMALSDAKGLKSLSPNGKIQPDAIPEKNKICVFHRSILEESEKSDIIQPVREPYVKERRKSKRHYASIIVIYKNKGDSLVTRTVNFSSGGVRINTQTPLDKNTPLELTLVLGNQAFECEGSIIYSQQNEDTSVPIQSGIKFEGLSLPDKKLIEDYFKSLSSDSVNYFN